MVAEVVKRAEGIEKPTIEDIFDYKGDRVFRFVFIQFFFATIFLRIAYRMSFIAVGFYFQ